MARSNLSSSYSSISEVKTSNIKKILTVLVLLFIFTFVVITSLLITALIISLSLQPVEYADKEIWDQISSLSNLTSHNYLHLPDILGKAITFPTVSHEDGTYNETAFKGLHQYLKDTFIHVYNSKYVEIEESFPSILFSITGTHSNDSFLLLAHLDVVPVDLDYWSVDPFAGIQKEGRIYGRGAIDDKLSAVSILCALNELLSTDWVPDNTFYIAFGHDEEVGGFKGAGELSKILEKKGVEDLFFILDEGMPVVEGVIKGVEVPIATIGVTEKGWLDVKVSTSGTAGHSSMPPYEQATHKLASALHNLHSNPQPTMIEGGPQEAMFLAIAPKSEWPHRLALSNMWLFRPLISHIMSKQKETDAIQRTTTATTIIRGGVKDNVVPGNAWALVNHRVHPLQSLEEVVQHDIDVINDPTVNVTILGSKEAHPVSPFGHTSSAFSLLASAITSIYPTSVPAPSLLIANTDTRHYLNFSRSVYRFMPYLLDKKDLQGIHGHDESISLDNVFKAAQFYHKLILMVDNGWFTKRNGYHDSMVDKEL